MGEIRIVGSGKTRGYHYLVWKKERGCPPVQEIIHELYVNYLFVQADKPCSGLLVA